MDPRRGERHTWMKTYLKVRFFLFPVKFQKKNNKVETCCFLFFIGPLRKKRGKNALSFFIALRKLKITFWLGLLVWKENKSKPFENKSAYSIRRAISGDVHRESAKKTTFTF